MRVGGENGISLSSEISITYIQSFGVTAAPPPHLTEGAARALAAVVGVFASTIRKGAKNERVEEPSHFGWSVAAAGRQRLCCRCEQRHAAPVRERGRARQAVATGRVQG